MELSRDDNANINMQDPNEEEYEKVRVHYVCAGKLNNQINSNSFLLDCGKDNTLDKDAVVICMFCRHRIFYKKRERKLLQYEAR